MANIYKSNYTGEQIDNSVGLTQENTATQGQVLTANGTGGASWQDASVGTEVVANPTSGATEELSKLQVGSNVYSIPKGTEVVANPTSGAIEELSKLQVGSNVYSIPSGGSVNFYEHSIYMKSSDNKIIVTLSIITNTSVSFTRQTLASFLYNNGYRATENTFHTASGAIYESGNGITDIIIGVYNGSSSSTDVSFVKVNKGNGQVFGFLGSGTSFKDIVRKL